MENVWPYLVLILCVGITIPIVRVRARRKKDYRDIIEPELRQYGYEFISSTTPSLFDVGPFPKLSLEVGGVQTKTPVGRGEYTEYRIVQFKKLGDGIEKVSWIKLDFSAFQFDSAEWKPELRQSEV
jgi:hypothetical protein